MANLRDIRARITSVKSTQKITKAMKMVSASKLRRYQDQFGAMQKCQEHLTALIANVKSQGDVEHPFIEEREPGTELIVVISADRGLCGGFNSGLAKFLLRSFPPTPERPREYCFIGKKAFDLVKRKNISAVKLQSVKETQGDGLNDFFKFLEAAYLEGKYSAVHIVYNRFKSTIAQIPTCVPLLPLTAEHTSDEVEDYIVEPDHQTVLHSLFSYYAYLTLCKTLVESTVSEHAARMAAMESASKNASEMIGKLTLYYNRSRQAAITKELIEIISGAEAVA